MVVERFVGWTSSPVPWPRFGSHQAAVTFPGKNLLGAYPTPSNGSDGTGRTLLSVRIVRRETRMSSVYSNDSSTPCDRSRTHFTGRLLPHSVFSLSILLAAFLYSALPLPPIPAPRLHRTNGAKQRNSAKVHTHTPTTEGSRAPSSSTEAAFSSA